jgi:hypothetical protein
MVYIALAGAAFGFALAWVVMEARKRAAPKGTYIARGGGA